MEDDPVYEMALREQLVFYYKKVGELGLNEMSSGNLSVRFGDKMLISPNHATADNITIETIVKATFDGEYEGDRKPSSESPMHGAIYKKHPEAEAVVHTHSDYCVAVSCHVMTLPGFHYLMGVFGGNDVPCVPYSTFGSQSLAEDASDALYDRTACLLGNHGMVCHGPTLKRAVNQAHRLEIMCRQYVLSRQLGEPKYLTDDDWYAFHNRGKENQYGKNG